MRAICILITASAVSMVGCNSRDFGSNGGVASATNAETGNQEEVVVRDVRDRKDDRPTGPDAALYFAALDYERQLGFEKANALYEELIRKYSASSYAPYAMFGLGELHKEGLESEHDRYANALDRYRSILKLTHVDDELHALVLLRVAECSDELGDKDATTWAKDEVWKRFRTTRAGRLVPHTY
jgi:TolA-binding protein